VVLPIEQVHGMEGAEEVLVVIELLLGLLVPLLEMLMLQLVPVALVVQQ